MTVYIGLGSNLANPSAQIITAVEAIRSMANSQLVAQSSLYCSPPMGPQDQPDYINAVIAIETELAPHDLLDNLQAIEQQHGRQRKRHWGERTLDLDILLFNQQQLEDERLTVPHPGVSQRAFVLYPLAEIAPDLEIPAMGNIQRLVKNCPLDGLHKVEAN